MPFPILTERTRGGKIVLPLLAYLYGFLWCSDIKLLYVKLLTRLQNSVNSDFPVFFLVQVISLWRVLYHRKAKSLSRKLKNEGAKVRSAIQTSLFFDGYAYRQRTYKHSLFLLINCFLVKSLNLNRRKIKLKNTSFQTNK